MFVARSHMIPQYYKVLLVRTLHLHFVDDEVNSRDSVITIFCHYSLFYDM